MQKANETEALKKKVDILNSEIKTMQSENQQIVKSLEQNLKFFREANHVLKDDYDASQEKFDRHVKLTNN